MRMQKFSGVCSLAALRTVRAVVLEALNSLVRMEETDVEGILISGGTQPPTCTQWAIEVRCSTVRHMQ